MQHHLTECVLGYLDAGSGFVAAKNRDRTYNSDVALVHHTSDDLEYVVLYDPTTKYVEGYNATSGIGIMNVALANGTDFGKTASDEGAHIFRALINAKDCRHAARIMTKEGQEVYGSTFIFTNDEAYVLENISGQPCSLVKINSLDWPTVRTNHSVNINGAGYTPADGDDYLSSKVRHATAEILFKSADDTVDLLDSLNYPLFGNHSAYDTTRDTTAMRTCSQMAIDPGLQTVYFRAIPGRGNLLGVYRIGDKSITPTIKIEKIDYHEPTNVPFESWSTGFNESFDLARHFDPDDETDLSDEFDLPPIESDAIVDKEDKDNVQYYIDRENEIIKSIVSLQNLVRNKDTAMMHLMKNRDASKDYRFLQDFLDDAESSTMDLYSLKGKLRSKKKDTKNESVLRRRIRKLLREGAKGPKDIPAPAYVTIEKMKDGLIVFFSDPLGQLIDNPISGIIEAYEPDEMTGPCDGALVVRRAFVTGGFGPMLYDIMMEVAGDRGLTMDRDTLTGEAFRIWDYYKNKRPDVDAIPLTDCVKGPGLDVYQMEYEEGESPVDFRYVKNDTSTINALRASGKLIEL
jgi:hypothetical protein